MVAAMERIKYLARNYLPDGVIIFLNAIRRALHGAPIFIPFHATYNEDGLICNKNIAALGDYRFMKAYQRAVDKQLYVDPNIKWRCHLACWAGAMAIKLKGDFVECGVNKGFLSHILMDYLDFDTCGQDFYLVDTYQGFDGRYLEPKERDRLREYASASKSGKPWEMGIYEPCYDFVVNAFSVFKCAKIVKGSVPDILSAINTDRVAYLSIDMNCVAPELAAIEYFWPKMLVGGVVVLDDYAWPGHEAQKDAMDEFAVRNGTQILSLPTGQGLLIKT